jgi:hypothetical protein
MQSVRGSGYDPPPPRHHHASGYVKNDRSGFPRRLEARQYPDGSSGRDVAAAISKSLEKKALLIKLDGQVLDLDRPLTPDLLTGERKFEILTREPPRPWRPSATTPATCWPKRCRSCFPAPR